MKQSELIAKVAKRAGLSRASVRSVLDLAFEEIASAMGRADRINFPNFGTLQGMRKERCIRYNPRTGRPFEQKEKIVPKFKPSIMLTESLKNARLAEL